VKALSSRQALILDFIRRFLGENRYPPTVRDIVAGCKISSTSVADYNLRILEQKGFIRRHRDVSRGIQLLAQSGLLGVCRPIPVVGYIAAGQPVPVPAAEAWDTAPLEIIEVGEEMTRGKEGIYALRVKGTSMVDDLINDGDLVLLEATSVVENGETAAVWLKLEKEVTLKKVYREKDFIRLQPASSGMKPILARPENVEVQGRVVAVIRQMA